MAKGKWWYSNSRVGPIAVKMKAFKEWCEKQKEWKKITLVRKGAIIIDAMIEQCSKNKEDTT